MQYPPHSRALSGPRRRFLLASAAGTALLAGCSHGSGESEESTGGSPSLTARARARAARESAGLLQRYDAVLAAHPAAAERLRPLRAEVVRHTEAFGGTVAKGSPASASPSASAPPSAPPSAPASGQVSGSPTAGVPVDEKEAVAQLAAAERALADRRTAALLDVPGELARLLASVAAAGAAHAYLLTEGAR